MHCRAARSSVLTLVLMGTGLTLVAPVLGQERPGATPRVLTADDYARAERFMTYNTTPLVFRSGVRANWLPGDRFWYRNVIPEGSEFILVDPAKGIRAPAFDHAGLAAALSAAVGSASSAQAGARYDAFHLPFTTFDFSADGRAISFSIEDRRWTCVLPGGQPAPTAARRAQTPADAPPAACTPTTGSRAAAPRGTDANEVRSPDGRLAVFIRAGNLWVRDLATGTERALTTDGARDFGYATDNAGWTKSEQPVVLWSPDSRKIATFQQDQRGVGEMYLVETKVGHPALQSWKYPLPGDEVITTIQRVVIHVDGPRVVRLKMPPDQHRGTIADDIKARSGELEDVQWSPDASRLAFVSTSRDHKEETLRVADPDSGEVRNVLEEQVATFFESGNGRVNWRFLAASGEVIWFS